MAVTSLMENLTFDNGNGIDDFVKHGIGPLREYAGMISDYAEVCLDDDQRLWMIKDLMLDQIDEIEAVLHQFKSEIREAAAQ